MHITAVQLALCINTFLFSSPDSFVRCVASRDDSRRRHARLIPGAGEGPPLRCVFYLCIHLFGGGFRLKATGIFKFKAIILIPN